jgi:hypothetical protein
MCELLAEGIQLIYSLCDFPQTFYTAYSTETDQIKH